MALKIKKLYAHKGNYKPGGNSCKYIVVHNTGNTASAKAEATYAHNDQHKSSFHYVLDGKDVYQCVKDTDTAWAVGAWKGAKAIVKNNQSISIEVCSNGKKFSAKEIAQLKALIAKLRKAHNIPASHVIRHYDCHTGRKACPAYYVKAARWKKLKEQIV